MKKTTYSTQLKNIDPRLLELLKDTPPEKFESVIKNFAGKVHNLQDWAKLTASLELTKDKIKTQENFLNSLFRAKRLIFLFTPIFMILGGFMVYIEDYFVFKFLNQKLHLSKAQIDYLIGALFFGCVFNVSMGLIISSRLAYLFHQKEVVSDPVVSALLEFFTPSHVHDPDSEFFTTKDLRRLLFAEKEIEIGGRALWARLEKNEDFSRAQGSNVGKGRGMYLIPKKQNN